LGPNEILAGSQWALIEVRIKRAILDLHTGKHDCPVSGDEVRIDGLGRGCDTNYTVKLLMTF
jgi:hypothetical protein